MKTVIYFTQADKRHDEALEAFAMGALRSGAGPYVASVTDPQDCDIAVVFGVEKKAVPFSKHRGEIIRRQQEAGKKVIVLETGYVDRDRYYAAGFGGLNNRADFRNKGMPGDRWEALGVDLKPWREKGEHIVLCGQIPWDASVQHTDHLKWIHDKALELLRGTQRDIVFRGHPLYQGEYPLPESVRITRSDKPLAEDLKNARALVTFNSNSAVEAIIAGVPALVSDHGSMAWNVAEHSFLPDSPATPLREKWAHELAYTQWTLDEFRDGSAWRHLTRD